MKRLLRVNGWPSVGGAEQAQFALFERLGHDFETRLVFPDEVTEALTYEARKLSIPYTTAPLTQLRQTFDPRVLSRDTYRLLKTTRILVQLIRRHSIDLIHTAYLYDIPFCAPAAKLTRTPIFWLIENPERFNYVNRTILNLCGIRGYAGVSSAILQEAKRARVRAPFTTVIPNSFRETDFFPAQSDQVGTSDRPFTIGYAGIFFGRKKVIELCQAFGMLCDRFRKESRTAALPVLYLAGRGQPGYVDSMNQALCSHEVRDRTTFFADINTPDEMRRFYQGLDLYIMLSTREGLSVSGSSSI